jgi:MYXO-CTERM domain-containing protein
MKIHWLRLLFAGVTGVMFSSLSASAAITVMLNNVANTVTFVVDGSDSITGENFTTTSAWRQKASTGLTVFNGNTTTNLNVSKTGGTGDWTGAVTMMLMYTSESSVVSFAGMQIGTDNANSPSNWQGTITAQFTDLSFFTGVITPFDDQYFGSSTTNVDASLVPEPSTYAAGFGLLALAAVCLVRRRWHNKRAA